MPAGQPGEPGPAGAMVDWAVFSEGTRTGGRAPVRAALESARPVLNGFVWIRLPEPDAPSLRAVAREFGLHELAVEDALFGRQRPKVEMYGDTAFVVLKTVRYVEAEARVETGELMIFVGTDFVVTVRHGDDAGLSEVCRDLDARPELLRVGPSAVLYAVADRVVDGYTEAVEAVQDDVDETEAQVFSSTRGQPTERIYKLTREVLELQRAVEPLVPVAAILAKGDLPGTDERASVCLRDVQDHVIRADEQVRAMERLLTSALAANSAQVAVGQNEDVRRISAWVAIVAVCSLVAGVYGMNFHHMPEYGWRLGYPLALGAMLAASLALYLGFRRNHWL